MFLKFAIELTNLHIRFHPFWATADNENYEAYETYKQCLKAVSSKMNVPWSKAGKM